MRVIVLPENAKSLNLFRCVTAAEKMYAKRKGNYVHWRPYMNMLKSSDNPNGPNKDLTKFIEQFCLTNVIHEATRTTNYSKTLLDVVLTSHPERLEKTELYKWE